VNQVGGGPEQRSRARSSLGRRYRAESGPGRSCWVGSRPGQSWRGGAELDEVPAVDLEHSLVLGDGRGGGGSARLGVSLLRRRGGTGHGDAATGSALLAIGKYDARAKLGDGRRRTAEPAREGGVGDGGSVQPNLYRRRRGRILAGTTRGSLIGRRCDQISLGTTRRSPIRAEGSSRTPAARSRSPVK
jgi:hypothetical protein